MIEEHQELILRLHEPFVQKGAVWFDETVPGWVDKVDTEKLNLGSVDNCICGQIYGAYAKRPGFVFCGADFGFYLRNYELFNWESQLRWHNYTHDEIRAEAYKALKVLWLDEIFWRRNPDWLVEALQ